MPYQNLNLASVMHMAQCVCPTTSFKGGVLSLILFTIYIDDLLFVALENNGVGCFWKHHALCWCSVLCR